MEIQKEPSRENDWGLKRHGTHFLTCVQVIVSSLQSFSSFLHFHIFAQLCVQFLTQGNCVTREVFFSSSREALVFAFRLGFPPGSDSEKTHLQCRRPRFNPWVRKIPWRREWLPPPVFLPGEPHGQRGLVSYRPWGPRESTNTDTD